ncbi:MAG: hypothetical protein ACRC77_01300 [Bacteroidales bacterium]
MLRHEVILLPETDRLVISEDVIRKLPVGSSIRSRSQTEGENGIVFTKQENGVFEIEGKRDTVRVALTDTFVRNESQVNESEKRSCPYLLYVGFLLVLIFIGRRSGD